MTLKFTLPYAAHKCIMNISVVHVLCACPAGELFDFDAEVEPLLEVLVGKVLEQALMEVLEEEEIAALQQHQAHFEAIRWGQRDGFPASRCSSFRMTLALGHRGG